MENRGILSNDEILINYCIIQIHLIIVLNKDTNKMINLLLQKFNGLILLYCLTYMSISRVSGAYDHKMQKGKVLDF